MYPVQPRCETKMLKRNDAEMKVKACEAVTTEGASEVLCLLLPLGDPKSTSGVKRTTGEKSVL